MAKHDFSGVLELIRSSPAITLIAHIAPDGDTLGSGLALYAALAQSGKRVELACDDPVPEYLMFLPHAGDVKRSDAAAGYPAAIAVDCADAGRLGKAAALFERAQKTACVDHHGTNPGYAGSSVVDAETAAVGELIFELIRALDAPIDQPIAECLYTAIMTDTGNFAYSNTTPDTMRIAAELLALGADCRKLNQLVYRTKPYRQVKLWGLALSGCALHAEGKIAITSITATQMQQAGAKPEDSEGIIDQLRDIKDVEVAVFVRQKLDGGYKVSMRSKEYADVGAMCAKMQGGGHVHAAGYTDYGELEGVCATALRLAEEALGV